MDQGTTFAGDRPCSGDFEMSKDKQFLLSSSACKHVLRDVGVCGACEH